MFLKLYEMNDLFVLMVLHLIVLYILIIKCTEYN